MITLQIIIDIYSMCGIAGIIQQDPNRYGIDHLKKMTSALAHRGPDGENTWANNNNTALFCHRRLAIIDLSIAAAQPMQWLDRYSIVHNGEIFNYIELRKELQHKGYSFRTQSDTEVILAAYAHWNDECVEHFDGMFAFAIWDQQEQELFAARDRFGEKPFFYHFNQQEFVFSSEMKAFWAVGIERVVNLKMLFNYLTIGYTDNPEDRAETFFENIYKLPPASRLYYTPATRELFVEKYWDIDPDQQDKKITDDAAVEQFIQLFTESVHKRLRSDVSLGSSLSGGLDSSSIVATISSLRNRGSHIVDTNPGSNDLFTAFTAGFPGFEKDESFFAAEISNRFGLQHVLLNIDADDLITDWEKFSYHQEEPVGSASAFAQFKVFEKAKQHGIAVLLDGQGADETLAGYHKYYKWYWQELFQRRKLVRSGELQAATSKGIQERFNYKNVLAALFPDLAAVILERQYLFNALNNENLSKDFIKLQSKEAYYTTPEVRSLNGLLYFNTCVHGLEELLRYADRSSMAHGRELRLPFLSHKLVEFIFKLPPQFKIRQGWTKWLLRQSMSSQLPADITWRTDKVGFEPPQKLWMQHPQLQDMVREARQKLVNEKILNPDIIKKPVQGTGAYEKRVDDWRYLTAAALFSR